MTKELYFIRVNPRLKKIKSRTTQINPNGDIFIRDNLCNWWLKINVLILAMVFSFLLCSVNTCWGEYSRIVSLAPSITDSLYALGEQDKIIGVTTYCRAEGKKIVGTLLEPNVEKILSLNPDIVVATYAGNSPKAIARLKDVGLNVEVMEEAENFAEICANFLWLGRLVGKEDLAETMVRDIKKETELIFSKVKYLPQKKIFWQLNAAPLITTNNTTFAADLIRYSGGLNLFSDLNLAYARISAEEVIKRNPEVIIIVTMGERTEREKRYWLQFDELAAAWANKVFVVDSDTVCQPTPWNFLKGLKVLTNLIHPEVMIDE
ncbi:MAG: helical backbone metal receptor [Candidatus Omnitrophota bacterium]